MSFRNIIILVIIASYLSAEAQSLKLTHFEEKPTDLSARTNVRKDLNDTDCALVKVRLAIPGATFNGLVVGPVEEKTSEYWVYMAANAKKVTLMVPNYLPLEVVFADYGIPKLESKVVYLLTVQAPSRGANPTNLRPVLITTQPENTYITIDNLQFVEEGSSIKIPLGVGSHNYSISSFGYETKQGVLEVVEGEGDQVVNISLIRSLNSSTIEGNIEDLSKQVRECISEWKLLDAQNTINYMDKELADKSTKSFYAIQKLKYELLKKVEDGKKELITNIKQNNGTLNSHGKSLLQTLLSVIPDDYWLNIIKKKQ